jgi:hypothetical protein
MEGEMKLDAAPTFVLAKLALLQEEVTRLDAEVECANEGIARAQALIREPRGITQRQLEDTQAAWTDARTAQSKRVGRLSAAKNTLEVCKRWLLGLPEGTRLQPRKVDVGGRSLAEVRDDIRRRKDELKVLDAVPVPVPDIEERVKAYVAQMSRPKVTGIETGNLQVYWDKDWPSLVAFLDPGRLVRAVMSEVTAMANERLPVAQREQRMDVLEDEIRGLRYVEEKLIGAATEPVERSPEAPARAILGAEIVASGAEKKAERAA